MLDVWQVLPSPKVILFLPLSSPPSTIKKVSVITPYHGMHSDSALNWSLFDTILQFPLSKRAYRTLWNKMDSTSPPPYTIEDPNSTSITRSASEQMLLDLGPYQQTNDRFYISGAAYFAMRPSTTASYGDVLHYHMNFCPGAASDQIPFPQPHQNLQERDVNSQDWAAFVNHLVINYEAVGEKEGEDTKAFKDEKTQAAPSLGGVESKRNNSEYGCLQEVTNEWNEGFFIPRGLKIMLTVHNDVSLNKSENSWRSVPLRSQGKDRKSLGKSLHKAITQGDMSLIQLLLEAGADVNARPNCGKPSLTCAVQQGNPTLVRMLLKKGANLEATAPAGPTALYEAVTRGESELVALLLSGGANANAKPPGAEPALYNAASRGRLDLVKMLLDSGADVDGNPPGGTTAFYVAAKKQDLSLMRLLLKGRADVERKPPGGAPALYHAVSSRNREVAKLLIECGANIHATPPGGISALNCAVSQGDHDLVRLMLG